jgi:mRNA interferase MazF
MTCMARAQQPQRGEVWIVQFEPSVGAEIRKLRPAMVVSVNSIGRLPLRIVVPLTDRQPAFARLPWFVYLPAAPANGLTKDSGADAFQVKWVSENRLVRCLGIVTTAQLADVASAVAVCVGAP